MSKFDPNQVSFAEGAVRVERVLQKSRIKIGKVMTSKDKDAEMLRKMLPVSNIPKGFSKYQLPFVLGPSQLFITQAEPGMKVGEHSHDEGDGIRFIAAGSITYNGTVLEAGDWMFIPKGARYSLEVGPRGATMCYCYCCCCAGRADLAEFVSNPPLE